MVEIWRVSPSGRKNVLNGLALGKCSVGMFRGRLWGGGALADLGVEVCAVEWSERESRPQGPSNPWVRGVAGAGLVSREWDRRMVDRFPVMDLRMRRGMAWQGADSSVGCSSCRLW